MIINKYDDLIPIPCINNKFSGQNASKLWGGEVPVAQFGKVRALIIGGAVNRTITVFSVQYIGRGC